MEERAKLMNERAIELESAIHAAIERNVYAPTGSPSLVGVSAATLEILDLLSLAPEGEGDQRLSPAQRDEP